METREKLFTKTEREEPVPTEKQKKIIQKEIEKILHNFDSSKKSLDDRRALLRQISILERTGKFDYDIVNKSWTQEQIDQVIDVLDFDYDENSDWGFGESFILTTDRKKGQEKDTVSDLMAIALIKRLKKDKPLGKLLEDQLQLWIQNIQMVDSELRLNLISTALNNRKQISSHILSELVGFLALHGRGVVRQLYESLDNNKDDINKSLNAITILQYMVGRQGQAGFKASVDEATKTLNHLFNNSKNFFIHEKVKQTLSPPLESAPTDYKRDILNNEWKKIISTRYYYNTFADILDEKNISNPKATSVDDEEIFSDEDIEEMFNRYREIDNGYLSWQEHMDRKSKYESHDNLRDNYNIEPEIAKNHYNSGQIKQNCIYTKLNKNHGVIYSPSGTIDTIFQLDSKTEEEESTFKKNYGEISESTLSFFVNKVKKEPVYYLQIRRSLPDQTRNKIDSLLSISIPLELDRKFDSYVEFDKAIMDFNETTVKEFSSLGIEAVNELVKKLESLLNKRKELAEKKNLGFKSEDYGGLEFFLRFINNHPSRISPTAHFSIAYYWNIRPNLPDNLVQEFETRFNINPSPEVLNFESYDAYLHTDDQLLLDPFAQSGHDWLEIVDWLSNELNSLSKKIKSTRNTPETLSIKKILKKEGFNSEAMSDEEYEKLLLTYKTLVELPMREKIENEFGIELSQFSLREQLQFVTFLSDKTIDQMQEVKQFVGSAVDDQSKTSRVRAFLSLEFDKSLGENLFDIALYLDDATADKIFSKYAEIIDIAQKAQNHVRDLLPEDTQLQNQEYEKVIQILMNKANELLIEVGRLIQRGRRTKREVEDDTLLALSKYKSDLLLTASLFRTLKKESHREDISLEDIKGVHYETITLDEKLSEKDAQAMIQIYSDNYKDKPKLQKKLVEGFRKLLANKSEKTELYMLKQNDDVLAFMRFDNTGSNHKYAGSLNVSPTLRGSAIGSAFFEEAMNKQAEKFVLDADTDPTTEVCSYYIEKGGFVVDKVQSNYADTGKTIFAIERDDKRKDYYFRDKDISSNDLIKEHEKNFKNNIYKGEPPYLVLSFPANSKDLYLTSEKLVNEKKYRMTRYFLSDDKETVYCAFERAGS